MAGNPFRCPAHRVECVPVTRAVPDYTTMVALVAWRCPIDGRTYSLRTEDRGLLIPGG